eukprot:GFUD01025129.1.p1 GENE.GFUD01025129.1~~GFUD01025129.1.p1  ORF type:complete len:528 (+),score=179.43 GFUD01025129.1:79-1662(+)
MAESFVIVCNIPPEFHTSDLRRFFSTFVETDKFLCFHFRHRPEKGKVSDVGKSSTSNSTRNASYSSETCGRVHKASSSKSDRVTTCCIVKMKTEFVSSFLAQYHRKHWLDSNFEEVPVKCFISKVKFGDKIPASDVPDSEKDDSVEFSDSEFLKLPELQPPNMMPQGNVGTSTRFFLTAIKKCQLPAKLIGKLKLEFPLSKNRQFGSVPHEYRGNSILLERRKMEQLNKAGPKISGNGEESDPDDDNDTCEEWERHEALHNDVQANRTNHDQVQSTSYLAESGDLEQQEGTKEKAFEEEIELVWEKGRSGLNFYTDAQYWKSLEGDFDERNTDDWDVDMSVYYEKNTSHDKDANDAYQMRRSDFFRQGKHEESAFKKKKDGREIKKRRIESDADEKIGSFEVFTRGVGGKIMALSGWKAGDGLGKEGKGTPTPVMGEDEGQGPRDKTGMGYYGEKVVFTKPPTASPKTGYNFVRPPPPGARITTAYSRKDQQDPEERVDRSNPPLYLKFRDQPIKFCRGGVEGGGGK